MNEAAPETAADRYRRTWGYEDIAWFFGCKRRHAEKIAKEPGFPPAIPIGGSSLIRWAAPHVIRWFDDSYLSLGPASGTDDLAVAPTDAVAPDRTSKPSPRRGPDRAPAGRKRA